MKNPLFLPAVLLAGFAWAGSPEDSVFVLDCREPQSDIVYIWKCDSVFVEDSIAASQNQNDPSSQDQTVTYAENIPSYTQTRTVVREPKISGWEIFFWGVLEVLAHSDDGDHCRPARAAKHHHTLFAEDNQRPARERGTRRR